MACARVESILKQRVVSSVRVCGYKEYSMQDLCTQLLITLAVDKCSGRSHTHMRMRNATVEWCGVCVVKCIARGTETAMHLTIFVFIYPTNGDQFVSLITFIIQLTVASHVFRSFFRGRGQANCARLTMLRLLPDLKRNFHRLHFIQGLRLANDDDNVLRFFDYVRFKCVE